jgi:hypothetical protein
MHAPRVSAAAKDARRVAMDGLSFLWLYKHKRLCAIL